MEEKSKEKIKKFPAQGPAMWRIIVWLLVVWFVVFYFTRLFGPTAEPVHRISYSRFKKAVKNENVSEITVKGDSITGSYKTAVKESRPGANIAQTESERTGKRKNASSDEKDRFVAYESFQTTRPAFEDTNLMSLLEKNGVTVYAESEATSIFWQLAIGFLPWILIIGFFVWTSKKFQQRMGGPAGGVFNFGKSKAKMYTKEASNVDYNDIAGLDNAKKELWEIVEFLKEPSRFQALGAELPKGILLVGPPGVGKTLLARGTAGEADVPFFSISGSEFIEMFVGVGASRVRDMFDKAKKDAPSIIFVDEIDSIGRSRGTGLGGGHDEREQTLNQILAEMDGFSPRESVVVMAATNRPDVLDPALIRPGRFDRRITLERPQKNAREKILKIHSRKMPLADDVDLMRIAKMTVGFSGADLKNLVNEAALLAARKDKKQVEFDDFIQGRDKILMGIEREDVVSDEEKRVIAYHEAGHSIVAFFLPGADPLEKVTIIPRGRALGATEQIPAEERHNLGREYLLNRIAIVLGGRAAEKVKFGDITTGAGDDLKKATQIARRMVCQWGMSHNLGPATFSQGDAHPFLGREITQQKDFSEHTARIIDDEVRKILSDMEQRAIDLLQSKEDKLDALVTSLLESETLSREEMEDILGTAGKQ